jgi:hypothetical protein
MSSTLSIFIQDFRSLVCWLIVVLSLVSPQGALSATTTDQEFATAIGHPSRTWVRNGSAWSGVNSVTNALYFSNPVGNSEVGWFETQVTGPDVVKFSWDASWGFSLGGVFAGWSFTIDGEQVASIGRDAGEAWGPGLTTIGWTEVERTIGPGTHTLRWSFYGSKSGLFYPAGYGYIRQLHFGSQLMSYQSWATLNSLTEADGVPSADHDGDGIDNWLEYVFGTDPHESLPESNYPRISTNGIGQFFVDCHRRKWQPLLYTLQESSNLKDWTPVDGPHQAEAIDSQWDRIKWQINPAQGFKAYRVVVTPQ